MENEVKLEISKELVDYIESIGFKRIIVNSSKKYYTNSYGRQIRIDEQMSKITLFDKGGMVVSKGKSFSKEELLSFAAKGTKVLK